MTPLVFTPSDEPYLGRELLCAFDNLICSCLELNAKCAPLSHGDELTDFQRAACILVPQTITLALSKPEERLVGADVASASADATKLAQHKRAE